MSATPSDTTVVCQEDQACWDWATMGNHRIGGSEAPQLADIAHCIEVGREPIWDDATHLLYCEAQAPVAHVAALPATGSTSAPLVGGAGILLAVGAILSIFARRGAV